jgi:hypothetical protein
LGRDSSQRLAAICLSSEEKGNGMNSFKTLLKAMAAILLAWSNAATAITCADLEGASLYSQEPSPVYLGFFGSQFAADSINNAFGTYGSDFSGLSVRNSYGNYGSSFGTYSAFNDFTSFPPAILKRGIVIGYLTTNTFIAGGVSLPIIDANCAFFSGSPTPHYPEVPFGLVASDGYVGGVELLWLPALGAGWYEVYRGVTNSFGNSIYLGYTFDTNAIDTQVSFNQTYYYWVAACNDFGCSLPGPYDTGFAVAEAPNTPPIASAGSDIVVQDADWSGSELVQLNGQGSSDADGSIMSYQWFESGSQIATGSAPIVNLAVGVHNITLRVTDDDGDTGTDSVQVTVSAPPIDPPPMPAIIDTGLVAGEQTWAAIKRDDASPRNYAYVHHAVDGSSVTTIDVGLDYLVDAGSLDNDDPGVDSTMVVLIVDAEGTPKVRKFRLSDGVLIRTTNVLTQGWQVLDITVLADMTGDGVSDYAVLGRNLSTGENVAQVRSGGDGSFIKNVFFLNPDWLPQHLVALPNSGGGPAPELGLLATNQAGQIVVMVKDAGTNAFIKNVFYLNSNWSPIGALAVPDFASSNAGEVGLGAVNNDSGQIIFMVKDSGTNAFINNVFPLGSNWEASSGVIVPDDDGNGASELVALGVSKISGKIVIQVRDTASGAFIRNLSPLGSNWTPNNMLAFGSGDSQRYVLVAERKSDRLPVVQTINGISGQVLNNVFLN